MTTIARTATKTWTGAQSASTVLISVPRQLWSGRASLVALRGSGWARVLDGRSAEFWTRPAEFADHPTMRAFTDMLVVQFMSEDDAVGSALGVFESQGDVMSPYRPGIAEVLRAATESAWIGRGGPGEGVVHRHVVMEGAEPPTEEELDRYLDRVTEGRGGVERLSLDPDAVARREQSRRQ